MVSVSKSPEQSLVSSVCPESFVSTLDLDGDCLSTAPAPAKPILKTNGLQKTYFYFKHEGQNKLFVDRKLPTAELLPVPDSRFDTNYFVTLSSLVSSSGPTWAEGTANHKGARVKLVHTDLKLDRWRHHLIGYKDIEICQFLEYGFPLGLSEDPPASLVPVLNNHGSAYSYYPWVDKFVASSLAKKYIAGPFGVQPFPHVHISPLMTAVKKPSSRRTVFDATFSDNSLNNMTPSNFYLGQPIEYAFPRIEDFRRFVLRSGPGCYMWKRDLSSFFLQVPLDPVDYSKVAFVWRSSLYFFAGLMFGLRHSGYQGQKVTDAVTWRHTRLGLETDEEEKYQSINYVDDIGGCEETLERATASSQALSDLLADLGLRESLDKNHPPSTVMPYLGVEFDSVKMEMRVPPEKLSEVREELEVWSRKTTVTKKTLQQLLGRLFWISRCVKFSRPFMSRLLQQLKSLHSQPDNKKSTLSGECKKDIAWWNRYVRRFNGVELLYIEDPLNLNLDQLLETSAKVNCGDAQVWGGGSYFDSEYWSSPFPTWLQDPSIGIHLKEFYVVLASCWLWGDRWTGSIVYLFCDNDAVCETLEKEKPKDPMMQELLREFLYIVCTKRFTPIFRKISSKDNKVADFLSRCHDPVATRKFFEDNNLPERKLVSIPDHFFSLNSNW